MTKDQLIAKLSELRKTLAKVNDATGHVGVALEAAAYMKDFISGVSEELGNRMYDDPFFSYFQNASNDIHTQYPIKKMALDSAFKAAIRYISGDPYSDDGGGASD